MRLLVPIILLASTIGIYVGLIQPLRADIIVLQSETASFDAALEKSKELQAVRDGLLSRYNELPISDVDRLEKLLPDNVDNVRLILDINNIASRYNMSLKNTRITTDRSEEASRKTTGEIEKVGLSFSVSAPYETFLAFLNDLEQSLRIVDVASLNFVAGDVDFYEYSVLLNTYWLK